MMESKTHNQEESDMKTSSGNDSQNDQARRFNEEQHKQSWREAMRSSPKALLWC